MSARTSQKMVLNCRADGFPEPQYQWLQKSQSGDILVRGYDPELVIERLTYEHQGEWLCQAANSVGGRVREVQSDPIAVEVRGAPQVTGRFGQESEQELELVAGQDAVLDVPFCANPPPAQTWQLGDVRLAAGDSHGSIVAEQLRTTAVTDCYVSRLRIMGAHPNDSRDYRLNLKNEHGTDSHTIKLLVMDRVLSQEIFIAAVVGGILTILVISLIAIYMVKAGRCCKFQQQEKELAVVDLER